MVSIVTACSRGVVRIFSLRNVTILTFELRKRDPAVYNCYSVSDNRKWQNKSFMLLLGMWVERGASATAVTRGRVLAFVLKG